MTVSGPSPATGNQPSRVQREAAAAVIFKRYSGKRRLAAWLVETILKPLVPVSGSGEKENLDQVKRILVFEPGSLGDMVMLMPFLRSLRARFPDARLSLLCRVGGSKKGQDYAAIDPIAWKPCY